MEGGGSRSVMKLFFAQAVGPKQTGSALSISQLFSRKKLESIAVSAGL